MINEDNQDDNQNLELLPYKKTLVLNGKNYNLKMKMINFYQII